MKKYIRSYQKIYGMAMTRRDAMEDMHSISKELCYHIIKCIIYGESNDAFNHWVKEICAFLEFANDMEIKPKNRKLKEQDYLDTIFALMGDTQNDAYIRIFKFKYDNGHDTNPYPEFNIDSDLINRVFTAFNSIKDYMIPIFTVKNELKADDFYSEIYKIVDEV